MSLFIPDLTTRLQSVIRKERFEPDITRALLITTALIVPLTLAHIFEMPIIAVYVTTTAQLIASAKIGGTYPQRASILLLGTLSVMLAAMVGTLAGNYLITAVLFMALVAGVGSLARGLGDYGTTLGITAVLLFLFSLRPPNDWHTALERVALVGIGGAWASALMLLFWPIRPHRPFYLALAKPWEVSSEMMPLVEGNISEESQLQTQENALRQAANQVLPWLHNPTISRVSVRREIVKIVRAASRLGATAIALHDELRFIQEKNAHRVISPILHQCLNTLGLAARSVSDAISYRRRKDYVTAQAQIRKATQLINALKQPSDTLQPEDQLVSQPHIFSLLDSSVHYLQDALILLKRLEKKKGDISLLQLLDPNVRWQNFGIHWWHALQPTSSLVRHSLRVALVAAIGIVLYFQFDIPRGYWIVLTSTVVLQPDFGTTRQRGVQRVIGTIIGGLVGTLLLFHPFHFTFLVAATAISCFMFVYYQARNYKIAVIFVTIMLVAMLEAAGQASWNIAAYRLLATVIGGALAIAAAYTLWPSWESMQFPSHIAKAIRANKNFLLQITYELRYKTGFHPRVIADQRKAEVETMNTLETIKRMSLEPGYRRTTIQEAQKLTYHNAKLTRELTALAAYLPTLTGDYEFPVTGESLYRCAEVLEVLAVAAASKQATFTPPDLDILLAKMDRRIAQVREEEAQATASPQLLTNQLEFMRTHMQKIIGEIAAMASLIPQIHPEVQPPSQTLLQAIPRLKAQTR